MRFIVLYAPEKQEFKTDKFLYFNKHPLLWLISNDSKSAILIGASTSSAKQHIIVSINGVTQIEDIDTFYNNQKLLATNYNKVLLDDGLVKVDQTTFHNISNSYSNLPQNINLLSSIILISDLESFKNHFGVKEVDVTYLVNIEQGCSLNLDIVYQKCGLNPRWHFSPRWLPNNNNNNNVAKQVNIPKQAITKQDVSNNKRKAEIDVINNLSKRAYNLGLFAEHPLTINMQGSNENTNEQNRKEITPENMLNANLQNETYSTLPAELLELTFGYCNKKQDIDSISLVCKRWNEIARSEAMFREHIRTSMGDPSFFLVDGQTWEQTFKYYDKFHKMVSRRWRELANQPQTLENILILDKVYTDDPFLYFYQHHALPVAIAIAAGNAAGKIQISEADKMASLLKHPCISYNIAVCIGATNIWTNKDYYQSQTKLLLDKCHTLFGVEHSRAFLNKWLPSQSSKYIDRNELDKCLNNAFEMISLFEKTGTFKESFEATPDWQLQKYAYTKPHQIQAIVSEAIKRAVADPDKERLVYNIIGSFSSKIEKQKIEEQFVKAKEAKSLSPALKK